MNPVLAILKGEMLPTDTYAVALYTKLPDTWKYTTTFEVRGQGYTAGGKTLESPVYGESETGAWMNFTGQVVWPNATIAALGAIVYNTRTRVILRKVAFAKEVSSTNDSFKVDMPSEEPLIQITLSE